MFSASLAGRARFAGPSLVAAALATSVAVVLEGDVVGIGVV